MRALGLEDEEIKKFVDTDYWLDYFPPATKVSSTALPHIAMAIGTM